MNNTLRWWRENPFTNIAVGHLTDTVYYIVGRSGGGNGGRYNYATFSLPIEKDRAIFLPTRQQAWRAYDKAKKAMLDGPFPGDFPDPFHYRLRDAKLECLDVEIFKALNNVTLRDPK